MHSSMSWAAFPQRESRCLLLGGPASNKACLSSSSLTAMESDHSAWLLSQGRRPLVEPQLTSVQLLFADHHLEQQLPDTQSRGLKMQQTHYCLMQPKDVGKTHRDSCIPRRLGFLSLFFVCLFYHFKIVFILIAEFQSEGHTEEPSISWFSLADCNG